MELREIKDSLDSLHKRVDRFYCWASQLQVEFRDLKQRIGFIEAITQQSFSFEQETELDQANTHPQILNPVNRIKAPSPRPSRMEPCEIKNSLQSLHTGLDSVHTLVLQLQTELSDLRKQYVGLAAAKAQESPENQQSDAALMAMCFPPLHTTSTEYRI